MKFNVKVRTSKTKCKLLLQNLEELVAAEGQRCPRFLLTEGEQVFQGKRLCLLEVRRPNRVNPKASKFHEVNKPLL